MKNQMILKEIEKYSYWDMGIDELSISNYFDEVSISYYNEKKIIYKFLSCYKILANHCLDYDKEQYDVNGKRDLPPCFLQDISVEDIIIDDTKLYKVIIDAHPLDLEIWCKNINIISN